MQDPSRDRDKALTVKGFKTVPMIGCHAGIPVLDLQGKEVDGGYHRGLLSCAHEAILSDKLRTVRLYGLSIFTGFSRIYYLQQMSQKCGLDHLLNGRL